MAPSEQLRLIADLLPARHGEHRDFLEKMADDLDAARLPSRFQIGDTVRVNGMKGTHPVIAVRFFPNKIYYHVAGIEVPSDDVHEPFKVAQ